MEIPYPCLSGERGKDRCRHSKLEGSDPLRSGRSPERYFFKRRLTEPNPVSHHSYDNNICKPSSGCELSASSNQSHSGNGRPSNTRNCSSAEHFSRWIEKL